LSAAASEAFELELRQLGARPSTLKRSLRLARQKPAGLLGLIILVIVTFCAIFGPGITIAGTEIIPPLAPYDPNETDPLNKEAPPSREHILGTDGLGRDIFSRILYGARPSLIVGFASTAIGLALGAAIGLFTGYVRGAPDLIIQRVMDGIMAIPPLVLLLALVSITSPSLQNVILILVIFIAPSSSRVVRGTVLTVKENAYVDAATAMGASPYRVVLRHILPNILAPIMVLVSVIIGGAILVEASLSFLGLGVPPPDATWGSMLSGGNTSGSLQRAPWIAIAPGLAITFTVLAFNLLGDALRDILDPRLRGT
jgi:ABC-type dipeptide/oligopeptide/nickel transport system permease subunit